MIDDDDLEQRLRRTFEQVASAPVPPAPSLPTPLPVRRWNPTVLVAAAAVLVAVAVAGVLVAREQGEDVDSGQFAGPTSTVAPDGTVTDRRTDGGLSVTATIGPGPEPGLVAVDVAVTDDAGALVVLDVRGSGITPVAVTPAPCTDDGPSTSRFGFAVGATTTGTVTAAVTVATEGCDGSARDAVELHLELAGLVTYAGVDGPRSPSLVVAGAPGSLVIDADGVDGCLAEVQVGWGDVDRSLVEVPELTDCTTGSNAAPGLVAEHDYAPGTYTQRISVTTLAPDGVGSGQTAFLEREVTIP